MLFWGSLLCTLVFLRQSEQLKLCRFQDVALGEGRVRAFTLIEMKRLFSIIFYKWETIDQVRFHSHAFKAIAFLLWGLYHEERITNGRIEVNTVRRKWWPRFLPRNYCHAIKGAAPSTFTVVFTGPWQKTWWEYFPDRMDDQGWVKLGFWQEYTWGRTKLRKITGTERETPWNVQEREREMAALNDYLDDKMNV